MSLCPALQDLTALIDGDLASERELAVRRHLAHCPICWRRVDGMTALKQAVGRAYGSAAPSPALRRGVMAGLVRRPAAWSWRRWAEHIIGRLLGALRV